MTRSVEPPTASIIVRTRNRPAGLKEAVESLQQQTYAPLEIILVNDFPKPIELSTLNLRPGSNVKVIHLRSSRGRSAAANMGLQAAEGKYVGFLDDDDVLYPDHVQKAVTILESNPSLVGVYTDLYATSQERDPSAASGYRTSKQVVQYCRAFDREQLFLDNYIPINAMLFRRDCIDDIGYFDEGIEVLEDWDLWIRMAMKGDLYHLCAVTGEYRIRSDETNSTHRLKDLFPLTRKFIYRKYAERSFPYFIDRFVRGRANGGAPVAAGSEDMRDRVSHLEQLLQEKDRELADSKIRLQRYLDFPLVSMIRRIRRIFLGLPTPPANY